MSHSTSSWAISWAIGVERKEQQIIFKPLLWIFDKNGILDIGCIFKDYNTVVNDWGD